MIRKQNINASYRKKCGDRIIRNKYDELKKTDVIYRITDNLSGRINNLLKKKKIKRELTYPEYCFIKF